MTSDRMRISITGDCMCLREQLEAIANCGMAKGEAFDSIFKYVKPLLEKSDCVIGNLETPVCSDTLSEESICFNTPPEFLNALYKAGFRFMTTANNHALDRGVEGLCQTLDNLDKAGIAHTGTYRTEAESKVIAVLDVKGLKVGIVSCSFGTNSEYNGVMLGESENHHIDLLKKQNKPAKIRFNPSGEEGRKVIPDNVTPAAISNSRNQQFVSRILEKVRRARNVSDISVIMPHVGGQYNPAPASYTKYVVSKMSEMSPSLIVAGHPHVVLRTGMANTVPIVYSLGNFCFTPGVGYWLPNVLAEYGVILHLNLSRTNKKIENMSFTVIKNIIGEDGISRPVPVKTLYDQLETTIEREALQIDVEAIVNKFKGGGVDVEVLNEYQL